MQILVLGLVAIFTTSVTTKSLEDDLAYQIEQLTPLLNTTFTTPLLQRDYASVISIASEFAEAGNISKISVFDSDRKLITSALNTRMDESTRESAAVLVDIPLAFEKTKLGYAEVWLSRHHLIETQKEITAITMVIFLSALILFVALAIRLSNTVTKPITELALRVKDISRKDFKFDYDRSRKDEIGDLESAFYRMSIEIRSKIDELNRLNADLEARVVARTSEVRQVADQLAAQVEQLKLLAAVADNSHFAISIIDASTNDYKIIYTNPAFFKVMGFTQSEAIGMKCRIFDNGIEDPAAMEVVNQAITSNSFCTVEFQDTRKNGEHFWNRLALFPVMIDSTEPEYFVIYQSDITQYMSAKIDREMLLQQMQESQKFESLGIMVAGLAHEVNNPLGLALSAASHLTELADGLPKLERGALVDEAWLNFAEDEAIALTMILENIRRATVLINGFKEVAADKSIDVEKPINLHDYLETIKQSLTPVLKGRKCELNLAIDPSIRLLVNSGGLSQIISNLVINATIHAFKDQTDRQVFIESSVQEDNIVLSIRDNGVGFTADGLKKAFTPFYTTRRSAGGTGLGLYISKQTAITKLKGDLILDQEFSPGTRFLLSIPYTKIANNPSNTTNAMH